MEETTFVISDEWLSRWRPGPGESWQQAMLQLLGEDVWPTGRRGPVAGWKDRVRGRVISEATRVAFERMVRRSLERNVTYHAEALDVARQRLAVLEAPVPAARPREVPEGWTRWPAPIRLM
jgi:hypothetical protein